jgi:hypothetical protein
MSFASVEGEQDRYQTRHRKLFKKTVVDVNTANFAQEKRERTANFGAAHTGKGAVTPREATKSTWSKRYGAKNFRP